MEFSCQQCNESNTWSPSLCYLCYQRKFVRPFGEGNKEFFEFLGKQIAKDSMKLENELVYLDRVKRRRKWREDFWESLKDIGFKFFQTFLLIFYFVVTTINIILFFFSFILIVCVTIFILLAIIFVIFVMGAEICLYAESGTCSTYTKFNNDTGYWKPYLGFVTYNVAEMLPCNSIWIRHYIESNHPLIFDPKDFTELFSIAMDFFRAKYSN